MEIFDWKDIDSFSKTQFFKQGTGVSVGSFDGLHLGHRVLLEKLVLFCSKCNLSSGLVTFSRPLPSIKHSDDYTGDISTLSQRLRFFEQLGIDFVFVVDFDQEFAALKGSDFLTMLHQKLNMNLIAEGIDFKCGYKGATAAQAIKYWAEQNKVEFSFIDPVYYTEPGGNLERVSSSYIRQMINKGFFTRATELLSRPYEIDIDEIRREGQSFQVLPPDGFYQTVNENGEQVRLEIKKNQIADLPQCSRLLFL